MATYYVDYENGDEVNDGSDWLNAKKQLSDIVLSLVDDDEVRIAKTPDAISIGNASCTKDNNTITLSTARTLNIEKAIGNTWSLVTNVTGGTSLNRKIGANSQQLFLAHSVSGKVGWMALPSTLDLSSYRKVSFMIDTNNIANFIASGYKLCLCSDSNGDTVVNEFEIPEPVTANVCLLVDLDYGAFLSNNINSVAIYRNNTLGGTHVIRINNIFATNDLSLTSVLGIENKNDFGAIWYPICGIDEETITLGVGFNNNQNITKGWFVDDTGTYELFVRTSVVELTRTIQRPIGAIYTTYVFGVNPLSDEVDGWTLLDVRSGFNVFQGSNPCSMYNLSIINQNALNPTSDSKHYLSLFDIHIFNANNPILGGNGSNMAPVVIFNIFVSGSNMAYTFVEPGKTFAFYYHVENMTIMNCNISGLSINSFGGYFKNILLLGTITQNPFTINGSGNIVDTFENRTNVANRYNGGSFNRVYNHIGSIAGGNFYPGYMDYVEADGIAVKAGDSYQHSVKNLSDLNKANQVYLQPPHSFLFDLDMLQPDGTPGVWRLQGSAVYSKVYKLKQEKLFPIAEIFIKAGIFVVARIFHKATGEPPDADYNIRLVARAEDSNFCITEEYDAIETGSLTWKEVSLSFTTVNDGLIKIGLSGGGHFFGVGNFSLTTS